MRRYLFIMGIVSLIHCSDNPQPVKETVTGDGICSTPEINPEWISCLPANQLNSFEIITWNLKQFPLNQGATVEILSEWIQNIDADVIAFQEIQNLASFIQLDNELTDWVGAYTDVNGDLDFAFLFKKCSIAAFTEPEIVLPDIWPRPPVLTKVKHYNGLEITLLNIHLKCCGGEQNTQIRTSASVTLKEYLDSELKDEAVILLGDYNDVISDTGPFSNFISDDQYVFADASIAEGSSDSWSYPSWPSHIDHILISDELFSSLTGCQTLLLDNCLSSYESLISDHRPLMVVLE